MAEKRTRYKLENMGENTQVYIADEVVTSVAALAALEVEGVKNVPGNLPSDLAARLGVKAPSKWIQCEVTDNVVKVDLHLNLEYGANVPEVSRRVQERVKSSVENMTGLRVDQVNVSIAGISLD